MVARGELEMRDRALPLTIVLFVVLVLPSFAQMNPVDAEGHAWWQHAVFYEIYPRSFADSNSHGIGDIPGITSKLDYLYLLGVDAIWIAPMFPSPQVDSGYDVSDYYNVNPDCGTLKGMDNLLAHGKQRNILPLAWALTIFQSDYLCLPIESFNRLNLQWRWANTSS
jgi:hypothetical protein